MIFTDGSDGRGKFAFMNWVFDNGLGSLNTDINLQKASDFKEMGKAYLEAAGELLIYMAQKPEFDPTLDTMIFPTLFNIWHGLELLLKSGNMLCDILEEKPISNYSKHKIVEYADEFCSKMKRLGFTKIESNQLASLMEFVNECRAKNIHFDFARYTFQSSGDTQFYNTPNSDGITPNSCVNLAELARVLSGIMTDFTQLVDYLYDYVDTKDLDPYQKLDQENLDYYCSLEI